jgi:hypothetical protein
MLRTQRADARREGTARRRNEMGKKFSKEDVLAVKESPDGTLTYVLTDGRIVAEDGNDIEAGKNSYEVDYTFAVEKQPEELNGELGLDLSKLFAGYMEPGFATYVVTVFVEADTPEDAARTVTEKLAEYGDDYNVQVRTAGWFEKAEPESDGGHSPDKFNLLDVDFPSTRLYPEKLEVIRQRLDAAAVGVKK